MLDNLKGVIFGGITGGIFGYLLSLYILDKSSSNIDDHTTGDDDDNDDGGGDHPPAGGPDGLLVDTSIFDAREPDGSEKYDYRSVPEVIFKAPEKPSLEEALEKYGGPSKKGKRAPRLISEEEFAISEREKEMITFYSSDGVFVYDENDKIVDNPKVLFGNDMYKFGQDSNDPDVVFIRGEEKDYQIIKVMEEFSPPVVEKKPKKGKKPRLVSDEESSEE